MARALIICPTFDHQDTLYPTLESVRRQTFQDFEVMVIGDGAPARTADIMADIAGRDARFRYQRHPKHERTGEPHRDPIIRATNADIIAYIADDDLWLPWHLEWMVGALQENDFAHSMHHMLNVDGHVQAILFQFASPALREVITGRKTSCFGLSYAAHTRDAYLQLDEGWTTTRPGIATDMNMWAKFGERLDFRIWEMLFPTALHLHSQLRRSTDPRDRAAEAWRVLDTFDRPGVVDDILDRVSFAEHFRYLFEHNTPADIESIRAVLDFHGIRHQEMTDRIAMAAFRPSANTLYCRPKALDALDVQWRQFAGQLGGEAARDAHVALLESDPLNHDVRTQLAELLLQMNEAADALHILAPFEPGQTALKYSIYLPRTLIECQRFGDALEVTETLLEQNPQVPYLQFYRGLCLARLDSADEAIEALQACVQIDPGHGWAHFELGKLHAQQYRPNDARVHYTTALDEGVPARFCYMQLAVLEADSGNPEQAAEMLEAAMRDGGRRPQLLDRIDEMLTEARLSDRAAQMFRVASETAN